MKKIIAALIIISFVFAACSSNEKEKEAKAKDKYEQTKETLGETEKKNPQRFLTVEGHDRKSLIGQLVGVRVIKGTVINKASVASFKDVDVELSFFSKTGALLEKTHEMVYETIAPGGSANFKTKYTVPTGTDSVGMKIFGAKPE